MASSASKGLMLLALLLFVTGCRPKSTTKTTEMRGRAMTIDYKIIFGKPLTKGQKREVERLIQETFTEVDTTYNKWNLGSELSKLNHLPPNTPIVISKELAHLLTLTQNVVELTERRFDPTIEPLQKVWKTHLKRGMLPDKYTINAILPAIGWDNIHFDGKTFIKKHPETSLDLSGIAKGYCIDLLVERLNRWGCKDLFVEWGGEIRATGSHPDKRAWTVFISRLGNVHVDQAIAILPLYNQAIATSGDYLQRWSVGSQKYTHIINPFTYRPLVIAEHTIASVSVLAPSCALADGLATAAMIFSNLDEAKEWSQKIEKQYPEIKFWFVIN